MPRPYVIMEVPVMNPYVCVQCGVGQGRREWFVDLGLTVDQYHDVTNQAIYLCNDCYHNMTLEIGRLVAKFRKEHEKWDSDESPSYSWMEKKNDQSGESDRGTSGDKFLDPAITFGTDRDDQDTESNDPEPEPTDSGDANPVDDSNPDDTERLTIKFGSD